MKSLFIVWIQRMQRQNKNCFWVTSKWLTEFYLFILIPHRKYFKEIDAEQNENWVSIEIDAEQNENWESIDTEAHMTCFFPLNIIAIEELTNG